MSRRLLAVVLGTLVLTGCATTRMTAQADPTKQDRRYFNILVWLPSDDLAIRHGGELAFKTLSTSTLHFIPSHELFFPGRQYSEADTVEALAVHYVGATLVVRLLQAGETFTPLTSTSVTAIANGNVAAAYATTTTTNIRKPWASFGVQLFDRQSGQGVWIASASTRGNAFAGMDDLLQSVAETTVKLLKQQGMVPEN